MTDLPPGARPRQDNNHPDAGPPAERPPEFPRVLYDFVMAMRFFSRLGMGEAPHERPNLNRMAPVTPLASLTIGLAPALLLLLLCWLTVPPLAAAAAAVALLVALTGAMPEDAIADAMDGLFGGATPERRLEIMKDSRHGTYGVAAIVLLLVFRVTIIGTIAATNPLAAAGVMLAAGIVARSGSLWLSVSLPPARDTGASAAAGRTDRLAFVLGALLAMVLTIILAGPFTGLLGLILALVAAAGIAVGWVFAAQRLVGGQTGDLIGALHALIEVGVLLVLSMPA